MYNPSSNYLTDEGKDVLAIEKSPIPAHTLIDKLSANGAYADCYSTEIAGQIPFPQLIIAFYTTPLFKMERLILKLFVRKPSTDADVRQLADNAADKFAAWTVEARADNEMLMCDFLGRTRSWLMVMPIDDSRTRLYFGSAVGARPGSNSPGFVFRALLGFHQLYSVLLLYSAKRKIIRQQGVSR